MCLAGVVLVAGAQFIPVARTNPPVQPSNVIYAAQPVPSSVRSIFEGSCKNCHSNQTAWPWYSYVAPISWMVARDVNRGRSHLNFSEWGAYSLSKRAQKLEDICEQLANGDMPDGKYLLIHRKATPTQEQRDAVCEWVQTQR